MDVSYKTGDTAPALTIDAAWTDGYTAIIPDLTGAAATLSMRNSSGTVVINDVPAVIVAPTVTAAHLAYNWATNDLATAGAYKAEFHVTFADGKIASFPNGPKDDPYINVYVTARL